MKEKIFNILINIIITPPLYLVLLISFLFFGVSKTKRACIELLEEFPGVKAEELNMLSESGVPVLGGE